MTNLSKQKKTLKTYSLKKPKKENSNSDKYSFQCTQCEHIITKFYVQLNAIKVGYFFKRFPYSYLISTEYQINANISR